jgi:hypothetical protein
VNAGQNDRGPNVYIYDTDDDGDFNSDVDDNPDSVEFIRPITTDWLSLNFGLLFTLVLFYAFVTLAQTF